VTGIEVVKLEYWILKRVGFIAFGIFNGFNLKEYERYFGSHTEDVLIVSFSSIMGILDATHGFLDGLTWEESLVNISVGIAILIGKSLLSVVVSTIGLWLIKIIKPYFKKHGDKIKVWIKSKLG
jgi:hypothetical protein